MSTTTARSGDGAWSPRPRYGTAAATSNSPPPLRVVSPPTRTLSASAARTATTTRTTIHNPYNNYNNNNNNNSFHHQQQQQQQHSQAQQQTPFPQRSVSSPAFSRNRSTDTRPFDEVMDIPAVDNVRNSRLSPVNSHPPPLIRKTLGAASPNRVKGTTKNNNNAGGGGTRQAQQAQHQSQSSTYNHSNHNNSSSNRNHPNLNNSQTDWEVSPHRAVRNYSSELDERLRVPPPRIMDPRMPPQRLPLYHNNPGDEEDSLFDFKASMESMNSKRSSSSRKQQPQAQKAYSTRKTDLLRRNSRDYDDDDDDEDEDDTSVEPYGQIAPPPVNIHQRAQAAWGERKRRGTSPTPSPQLSDQQSRSALATFGGSHTVGTAEKSAVASTAVRESPATTTITSKGVDPPPFGFPRHNHHHPDESLNTTTNTLMNDESIDTTTIGDRSLNSEYTKSMESEVEDALKDLFLIGPSAGRQPGRRKVKHNPDLKSRVLRHRERHEQEQQLLLQQKQQEEKKLKEQQQLKQQQLQQQEKVKAQQLLLQQKKQQQQQQQERQRQQQQQRNAPTTSRNVNMTNHHRHHNIVEERDADTIGSETIPLEERTMDESEYTGTVDQSPSADGQLLQGAWSMVESSLSAVGAALGLHESGTNEDDDDDTTLDDGTATAPKHACAPMASTTAKHDGRRKINDSDANAGGLQGILDYVMGGSSTPVSMTTATTPSSSGGAALNPIHPIIAAPSLEEDTRLMELALQAAQSWHELQGYRLDPGYELNIVGDIKFSVVDLVLPLGLVFQENPGGCWVTQILSNGHAAKSQGVQVGDQLAAIDGQSAVQLRVHQVASAVRGKSNQPSMELTFLRYVGPLRPAPDDVAEEGYEVAKAASPVYHNEKYANAANARSMKSQMVETSAKKGGSNNNPASSSTKKQRTQSPRKTKKAAPPPPATQKKFRLFGRKK